MFINVKKMTLSVISVIALVGSALLLVLVCNANRANAINLSEDINNDINLSDAATDNSLSVSVYSVVDGKGSCLLKESKTGTTTDTIPIERSTSRQNMYVYVNSKNHLCIVLTTRPLKPKKKLDVYGSFSALAASRYYEIEAIPKDPTCVLDSWKLLTRNGEDITPTSWPNNINDAISFPYEDKTYAGSIFMPIVKPGKVLHGKITDGSDPVSGAEVQFTSSSTGRVYTATTKSNGTYIIALNDFEDGSVLVNYDGYKVSTKGVTAEEMSTQSVDLSMEVMNNPVSVYGYVIGCNEEYPDETYELPGANLYFASGASVHSVATADEAGEFEIKVESGFTGNLIVNADGFLPLVLNFENPITSTISDVEAKVFQDDSNSVALYFTVDGNFATVARNSEDATTAVGAMYHKPGTSYHFDWDTGDILVIDDYNAKNDAYRVSAKPGYAFFDWHVINSKNSYVPLELNAIVDDNLFFYGHFQPSGMLNVNSTDDQGFETYKVNGKTNEEMNPEFTNEDVEYTTDVYEGTQITFEDNHIKCHCEINEENAEAYIEDVDVEAVAKEGFEFAQWTLDGQTVESGTTITVKQFDNLDISSKYQVPSNEASQDSNAAGTGDYTFYVFYSILIMLAISCCVMKLRKDI